MNPSEIVEQANKKFQAALEHFQEELKKLRTGRANPAILDGVMVEAYGSPMPLNQVASIRTVDSQLLEVSPFDPNNLQTIAAAIRNNQSLGLNPTDDGRLVRVPIPPLTEERRKELAKQVGEKLEETMIALRNARHEALRASDAAKKDKSIGEDDAKRIEKQVDDAMAKTRGEAEAAAKAKENDIMTV
jgi:ribosome recycling factor